MWGERQDKQQRATGLDMNLGCLQHSHAAYIHAAYIHAAYIYAAYIHAAYMVAC